MARSHLCVLIALATPLSFGGPAQGAGGSRVEMQPNLIIIFADDMGYGDLGCYGHPTIRTPQLDRMARQGMKFTQFYVAASVCTPSRAALLTGRYGREIRPGSVESSGRGGVGGSGPESPQQPQTPSPPTVRAGQSTASL